MWLACPVLMIVSACCIRLPVANRFCPGLSEPWKMRLAKMLDSPCLPQWSNLQRKAWIKPHTWPAAGRATEAAWVGSEGHPPDAPAQCFCLCRTFPEGRSWLVCQVLPIQVTPDREVRVFFPSKKSRACLCLQWSMAMVLQRLLPVQCLWDVPLLPQLGVSVSTSVGMALLAQDTVALVSCQTCAGTCSGLHTTQKDTLKAPTIF